jgi:glycosyltransferase involved in cell wall biosynthesis
MTDSDRVTIGVPVYRGGLFIEETLRSIQKQTHRHIEVVISLDGPDPAVEQLCAPFLRDPRFRLAVQPERLGWVGNINWLMSQATAGFWCYHQQDDLIDPRYLEVLLDCARRTPGAAVVYCDIAAFGIRTFRLSQPSVAGCPSARQLTLLYEHHAAVAFRGLTRVEALRHSGRIRANEIENFSADTTWMAAIARSGDLQRVPMDLYRKRYHADNEHSKWATWPLERRIQAWTVHCADMLEEAMLVDASPQERRLLWLAAVGRLVSPRTAAYLPVATLTAAERASRLDGFFEYLRTARSSDVPEWLDANWEHIHGWTRGVYS